jgi:hypothetical protein
VVPGWPGKLAIVPARGHREPASQPRPVLDHDQVLIGIRARQKPQTRGGPEPRGAAPLISQAPKTGVTVHWVAGLARARPCGSGRSMRGTGPAHGRALGSQDADGDSRRVPDNDRISSGVRGAVPGGRERAPALARPGSAARPRALSPFSDRCL